jgi:hypothetical protein
MFLDEGEKPGAAPATHEQIDRHAVAVAAGRMRQAVASRESELDFCQWQSTMMSPKHGELGLVQKQLDVESEVPHKGVEKSSGKTVLLDAVPDAADRVAGQLFGVPA